ncbi:uncharacterized protein LOC128284055 [Gossypium arboreum]|uniref:uncharacterized protein LOC128284055 n=1 Tax=Gossypium arboreum TaxID=29729 RepID=UPI0022F1C83C|nr:uncharacterized protein LOC128284055 [Gossypium arboreum]
MIARLGEGTSYTSSKLPPKPLGIWEFEGSPFCRIVQEVLVELELLHNQHSDLIHRCAIIGLHLLTRVSRGSPRHATETLTNHSSSMFYQLSSRQPEMAYPLRESRTFSGKLLLFITNFLTFIV